MGGLLGLLGSLLSERLLNLGVEGVVVALRTLDLGLVAAEVLLRLRGLGSCSLCWFSRSLICCWSCSVRERTSSMALASESLTLSR